MASFCGSMTMMNKPRSCISMHTLRITFWLVWFGSTSVHTFYTAPPVGRHSSFFHRSSLASTAPNVEEEVVVNGDSTQLEEEEPVNRDTVIRNDIQVNDDTAFDLIAGRTSICLLESDIRRDAIGKGAGIQASSATNWINDESAFALQQALNRIHLQLPQERQPGRNRDEAFAWLQWLKSTPVPTLVDLSNEFRSIVNATLTDRALEWIDQKCHDFLSRMACRLVLLPSGAHLTSPLTEPPASIVYGKLLYGGVTRSRLLKSGNTKRRAGARTEIQATAQEQAKTWMMYGGPERLLEAVDMGPAAVLEVILLPRGKSVVTDCPVGDNMNIRGMTWKPQDMFAFDTTETADSGSAPVNGDSVDSYSPSSTLSGKNRNEAFQSDFRSTVGGLQPQIDSIVRRVLDGRVIRPADEADNGSGDETGVMEEDTMKRELAKTSLEAEELAQLGLTPVRGLLLYGPPGCGKTALAREISRSLRARTPKIVSAPELLDRWVGGSERLVRELFVDAEAELRRCNNDPTRSALHVIVIDEIDAVFRKRSTSAQDSGEATRSSVVNQILSKLDGVNAIPNVLMIGMTNRRELLDEALLRPGRLEVQIEIPKPDQQGRREILQIHFEALRNRGRLSQPLCCAVDGVPFGSELPDGDADDVSSEKPKSLIHRAARKVQRVLPSSVLRRTHNFDLAADYATGGFSGADIAGLVRCAGSIALARCRKQSGGAANNNGIDGLLITLEDVKQALTEVAE